MKIKNRPFILVIVGDSAAGKTTLLDALRRTRSLKSRVTIQDMDENGCPTAGREHWRKYRVEELFSQAVTDYQKSRSAIIGGWIWPHEIIASQNFSLDLNIHFLFLKNTLSEYRRRLKLRVGTLMSKAEFVGWVKNFPVQQQRLENQVRFTTKHSVINSWKETPQGMERLALELIESLTQN